MKNCFQSISYKLLSTLVIGTTLPMLIYCFFFFYDMRNSSEENYLEQNQHTWKIVSNNIDHSLSASIDVANNGIYLNSTLQDLLFSRNASTFPYAESTNASLLFSYMTNIFSMTPEATQIQFSTYKSGKSFLLTTKNLQKYLKSSYEANSTVSSDSAFEPYIIPPHKQTSYGHQLNHMSLSQADAQSGFYDRNELVFTVCLPIYHLPNPDTPTGELRIDISIEFFMKVCNFLYDDSERFYIVDSDSHIIFSSNDTDIGKDISESWIENLIQLAANNPNAFVNKTTGQTLGICQKIPGDFYDWYMVKSIPKYIIHQNSNRQLMKLLFTFGLFLLITILINGYSILHYTKPLKKATKYLNSINTQTHNLNSRLSNYVTYTSKDEIGILFRSLEEMVDTINNFVIRQYELEIINRTTELKVLEAQINPHFIYNTLQCLATKSLEHHDQEQYDYISSFGQLMQYSMDTKRTLVTIQDEFSHINRYINLQKMRFTSHLSVFIEAQDEIEKIVVPKMILQPLIENSFKHGNLFKQERGSILIYARIGENHLLHLDIIDNGCSPSPEQLLRINRRLSDLRTEYIHKLLTPLRLSTMEEGYERHSQQNSSITKAKENLYATNNIGLTNVLLRLLLNFGQECTMELAANELGGTTVHLVISHETVWHKK